MASEARSRPGPKPKRLYLRSTRFLDADRQGAPTRRLLRPYWANLERTGRLVAVGETTDPLGELLVLRAVDVDEAHRVLRRDPWRNVDNVRYEVVEWDPRTLGPGVNLEPAPPRGAGRLTALERISVVVSDQSAALAWYRDALGLTVRSHDPGTRFVELSLGKGAAALSLVEPRREWGEPYYAEARARIGLATGIAFQTDSVAALERRLRREGARVTQAPARQPWGGVTLRFTDPDGNEFLAFQRQAEAGPPDAAPPLRPAPSSGVRWLRRRAGSKPL